MLGPNCSGAAAAVEMVGEQAGAHTCAVCTPIPHFTHWLEEAHLVPPALPPRTRNLQRARVLFFVVDLMRKNKTRASST